jgi:hypothetical protein
VRCPIITGPGVVELVDSAPNTIYRIKVDYEITGDVVQGRIGWGIHDYDSDSGCECGVVVLAEQTGFKTQDFYWDANGDNCGGCADEGWVPHVAAAAVRRGSGYMTIKRIQVHDDTCFPMCF